MHVYIFEELKKKSKREKDSLFEKYFIRRTRNHSWRFSRKEMASMIFSTVNVRKTRERFTVELTRETKSESYLKGHLLTLTFYKNIYNEAHGSSPFSLRPQWILSLSLKARFTSFTSSFLPKMKCYSVVSLNYFFFHNGCWNFN